MYISHTTKFVLNKRHKGDTEGINIRLRVTLKSCRPLDFSIGMNTSLAQWDTERQRLTRDAADAKQKNRTLDDIYNKVEDMFTRYELIEKRIPTISELREKCNDILGMHKNPNGKDTNFFAVFDEFVLTAGMQNQWSHSTYQKFHTLRNHFTMFDKDISFRDINEAKIQKYMQYLYDKDFRNTTVTKHLGLIRWFLHWAADHGYYKGDVHLKFRPKLKGTDIATKEIIYLTIDEVHRLQQQTFTPQQQHLERVRDVFLFCCFSGLRYSDVAKLRRSDVHDTYISVVTQKTSDPLRIELNKHTAAILEKYAAHRKPHDLALPVISNQRMNSYLKTLGKLCHIDEPVRIVSFSGSHRNEEIFPKWALLTTHCARRTFVVTALQLNIPSEVIMKWTGHSDYESMKPYVAIVDELKAREMSMFDKL